MQIILSFQLRDYIRHKNWDTRTAATQALCAIAENVPQWNPVFKEEAGITNDVSETSSLAGKNVKLCAEHSQTI